MSSDNNLAIYPEFHQKIFFRLGIPLRITKCILLKFFQGFLPKIHQSFLQNFTYDFFTDYVTTFRNFWLSFWRNVSMSLDCRFEESLYLINTLGNFRNNLLVKLELISRKILIKLII